MSGCSVSPAPAGSWYELRKIGGQVYTYRRRRDPATGKKLSEYIGRGDLRPMRPKGDHDSH